MPISVIVQNKRGLHRHFLLVLALCLVFTLVTASFFGGNAIAGSVGDVVTQVSNANFGSPEFHFGEESATGHDFAIHAGMGDFKDGDCMLSVLGPAQPDEIQIMLDYVDSAQVTYMQTTQLKGCEVREYSTEYGVGIGVILPDYFITVETLETGNSQNADMASAKSIAQQVIDGMEKAGLLSQAAPDIIEGESQKTGNKTEDKQATGGETGKPLDEPIEVSNTMNIAGVYNGPTVPTTFSIDTPHLVTEIYDYHWNDAQGKTPGTIGLQDQNGKMYGPWQATGTPGQGGVPNANWLVYPNIVIPAGTYTVIDSDPSTWSQNGESGGKGMGSVKATPHFETTGTTPGTYPTEHSHSHSPAGVGSVGNIPGPSNTTEAVTGVIVPGLIATVLGVVGGLGGGGFVPPAGGTSMYPTGSGPMPGSGGIPGTGEGAAGMSQATGQFGRRGKEEHLIDTEEMYHGSATQEGLADQDIYIETEREAELFVQPEPLISDPETEIFIDTIDMNEPAVDISEVGEETGIHIDTTDIFETPAAGATGEPEIFIETEAEAGLFVSDKADLEMGADAVKSQAFAAREGEAGGEHVAVAGSDDGAPVAEQSAYLYANTGEGEILGDFSSPEDGTGTETAPGSEEVFDQNGFDRAGFDQEGFNREGFDQAGFDRDGYDRDGFNEAGYNAGGFDKEGYNQAGYDKAGYDQEGFDKDGYDQEGFDSKGRNSADYDRDGYNSQGYDQNGFDKYGFDKDGFNQDGFNAQGFDRDGFDARGLDAEGFDKAGFDANGFDKAGFDADGFDKAGFDQAGFDKAGFSAQGYDKEGFDRAGFDQEGFNREGFDQAGFDQEGFDKTGYNTEGFNRQGYNQQGFDREGFNKAGFDAQGYDRQGFDQSGFDQEGFNKEGFDQAGFNREGYNQQGFDREGFDKNGFNAAGYDQEGFDQAGFDKTGYDREGFNKAGFDQAGFDKDGFDKNGFNALGYDRDGFDKTGFDREGFDRQGFDQAGLDREGFNKAGFDTEGYDREGFNKAGFDREGYGRNGFDPEGFDRDGFDVNGYNRQGFNRQGFDAKGFDKQGFDKEGFDQAGWDREGYDRNGFDHNGWDREGYDKHGYDADGYDRDGFDREGQSQEGYDADGYDRKGFNEHGYDRDGYDREGFNYEGYNRSGRDPWGYDKQGYGKDGYHWSGYNADGYNRAGRHWTDNPYQENTGYTNPFEVETIDLGGRKEAWKPTKPPLGEPYHRTVEKYGAKPWDDEIPAPQPEKPTIPATEDTGVIGPEDPMNTLERHGIDQDAPTAPEGQDGSAAPIPEEGFPPEQIADTRPGNTFDYTDPETGVSSTYEYVPGYNGPRHGDQQTLVGTGDGRTYEIEFNAVTGKWVNTETGNEFDTNRFESWQRDFAEDKRQAAIALEKMATRQDAASKAIDQNLEDWRKLDQMQEVADRYAIGTPGGPGDVDKAIQSLKDDMLAGKELDREKMDKIRRVIGNRIQGKTTADTGERWEEDWFKNLGWALESNLATAREVFSGEKADGSISYLGTLAKCTMLISTAGLAGSASLTYVTLDGGMNVAEALFRMKDEIDKGGSDFRAVSKAVGLFVLGEQVGWLAGKGMGALNKSMLERFPAFTNKAADVIETGILKVKAMNQMGSRYLGMISKESAEEALDQINKRLVDIGSDKVAKGITRTARGKIGLSVADSFHDVSKGAGKTLGTTDGVVGRTAKTATEGWTDVGESGGRAATSSTDDIAKGGGKAASQAGADGVPRTGRAASHVDADGVPGAGKTASGASDDLAGGTRKVASSSDDVAKGAGKSTAQADAVRGPRKTGADLGDAPAKSSATGGDVPGEPPGRPPRGGDVPGEPPGRPPRGGDVPGEPPGRPPRGGDVPGEPDRLPLNRGARAPEEVLNDPAALNRAERTMQQNVKNFDQLPAARQQELIREQAIYDEYRIQAEERAWNLADKVQRGEPLTVEDIMEMKSDPASMRTLKDLQEMDGLGAQLTPQETQAIQREFNHAIDEGIHQPSYGAVEDHLHHRYPGADPDGIRVRTVRTPGTEPTDFNINTDNDVVAERLVHGPQGPEWVEIPKAEWEDTYYKALAENSGFSPDEATRRFPNTDWANMDEAAQVRQWAKQYEEAAMDQFDLSAGRDFSNQRTWRIDDGDLPGRPMIELTEDELAGGVDYVMVDGKPMRPSTGYELAQKGQGTMLDPEQLSLMERKKFDDYWNAGGTPDQVMRNQTEAMEQLRKTAAVAENVEQGYRNMGYRVADMPDNMKEAFNVVKDKSLSPAARAARLQELGYSSPGDFLNKVSSRIGGIRIAKQ